MEKEDGEERQRSRKRVKKTRETDPVAGRAVGERKREKERCEAGERVVLRGLSERMRALARRGRQRVDWNIPTW
jgi:hypothetical protein